MFGWTRRAYIASPPLFLPACMGGAGLSVSRFAAPAVCLILCFGLALCARILELPFWANPSFSLNGEYLLATHDAYHWIAGAEGFEFGAGHPMSELVRFISLWTGLSPAVAGFWLPPFMSGLLALAVFLWGCGLGQPYAGMCAGVLASLAPAFCARTLLGFYDTDLVILLFAVLLGLAPALWLSPWLISLPELLRPRLFKDKAGTADEAGTADKAGTADEAGEADEAGTAPEADAEQGAGGSAGPERACPAAGIAGTAADCRVRVSFSGLNAPGGEEFEISGRLMLRDMLGAPWLFLLIVSGLFGHWMQGWHSMFPYLVRFSIVVLPGLILVLGPAGGRAFLLAGALCHALPLLLGGWIGGLAGLFAAGVLTLVRSARQSGEAEAESGPGASGLAQGSGLSSLVLNTWLLAACWAALIAFSLDSAVFSVMGRSFTAYANRSGDMTSMATVADDPLIFPSVASSIIEVQTVSLREIFLYVYPIAAVTILALGCFIVFLIAMPAFVWFAPLVVLCLLSLRLGARMTMFGPPGLLLALCMAGGLLLDAARRTLFAAWLRRSAREADQGSGPFTRTENAADRLLRLRGSVRLAAALVSVLLLAWPLARLMPDYTQGPVLTREQAEGLAWIREHTGKDAFVWNWWDWGYATHHFARRHTIADGARHGGPSLYLPAAVYTTADPRFARQVIKYTALHDNVPAKVFDGLSASASQDLMRNLGDRKAPLVFAPGRQYIVVHFELLRIGIWVSRFGSWNFESKQGPGALMSNLSGALRVNVDTGVILSEGKDPVYASDIIFFENGSLERYHYNRYGAYHFIMNTQQSAPDELSRSRLRRFWERQRGPGVFDRAISDKLALDSVFYNTMMVQLLICPPDDPAVSPYFRLVFDNVYTRIWEVL